jgi:ribosomal protein S18 acetylase RimI-like enzyme
MERFEKHENDPQVTTMQIASEADIDVLIDIESSVPKSIIYTPMVTERAWKEELAENTVEIIRLGDVAVGSIAYEEKSPDHIYISGIIVRPEYQGRGIATKAIKEVLAKYPDAERIDLVTHPDNPALKLYESLGFVVEERKENYWGEGQPRLILARIKEKSS